jgi:transposase
LPGFCRHPEPHESAIGECHGEAEAGAAIVQPEFKAEAVKVVRQSEKSVAMVARELDLTETALRRWVEQAAVDAGHERNGALTTDERTELAQLRREVRTLRMERDILKKCMVRPRRAIAISATA